MRKIWLVLALGAAFGAGLLVARSTAPRTPLETRDGAVLARTREVTVRAGVLHPERRIVGYPKLEIEALTRTRHLARLAEQEGLQLDPAFVAQYADSLATLYVERKFEEPERKRTPTDDEVRAYFEVHRGELTRPERARIALIALIPATPAQRAFKRAAADAALVQVRAHGVDPYAFGELARVRSDDPDARSSNGELPSMSREELSDRYGPPLSDAAFSLTHTGDVLGRVVETEKAFFVVKLLGREPARNPTFEEMKDVMRARLTRERRDQHRKEFLDAIWKDADIRIDEEALAGVQEESRHAKAP